MPTNKDYNEKRNFIRMFVNAKVTITDSATGNTSYGEGKNLSGDGALFISKQEFTMDQKLTLDITSEQSKLASLSADFVVVRVKKLDNGQFEIGGIMLDVR